MDRLKTLINSGEEITHFAFGQSPFPPPEVLVEALREHSQKYSYLPIKGTLELRKGISKMHSKYDQLNMDPEKIIVGPGTKELLFLILNAFNGVILLASPTWTTYEQQCNLAGQIPLVLKTDETKGWKLTPQTITEVSSKFTFRIRRKGLYGKHLLHILRKFSTWIKFTSNFYYSFLCATAGTCYTAEELEDLSASCRENRILVISDEIYSRLTFNDHYDTMLHFYPEGTIMTNGFSKWASVGGWRLGYAYFPPSLKTLFDAVYKSASNTYSCAPTPMQYAIAQITYIKYNFLI
ncbi:Aspartate aminotransferase [Armadillidium nasatum]|uniref:Aspartate aminotransferase n=1 Tax=Armadillidium nasatum TaxID=96803 RepID=A0A5N5TJS8_9CRUS|nr:Aspartate aminotransferase [Armadillidium nasatum]